MPRYLYRAKRGPREELSGVVEADSPRRALELLRGRGLFPLAVEAEQAGRSGIRAAEVALFTRQLADLLDAGLPLLRALEVVGRQSETPRLAALVAGISAQVKDGRPLSEALEERPGVFAPIYLSVLKAGERGGNLAAVLGRLADFYEGEVEFRSRLQAAAAYPLLVLLVGVGTVLFLFSFVVPRLGEMFGEMGESLPRATRLLLALSRTWSATWWAWLVALALAALASSRLQQARGLFWRLPLLRQVAAKAGVARFARTLATLISNGVPLLEALRISAGGFGTAQMEAQLREAARQVEGGSSLAEALRGRLPEFVCHMIAVGEEGGRLEKSLEKVALAYEREFDRSLRVAMSLLEPAMILGVGGVVGFVVLAMLLPILQVHTLVR